MLPLAKEDVVTLDKLIKSILGQPDPLAKILAKLLIEKGVITMPDLVQQLWAEGKPDQAPSLEGRSQDGYVDAKGKLWTK